MDAEFRLAEGNYGVVTRSQLRKASLSDDQIDWRIRTGRLELVYPNVYRVVGSVPGPRQTLRAATLWLGADSCTSHVTAATLYRLDGVRTDELHVTIPSSSNRGRRASDLIVHRSTVVRTHDRRLVDGSPCTCAARTLVDCAALLDDESLETAIESARRRGLTTVTTIRHAADEAGIRAGRARLRRVLSVLEARPKDSWLEVKLARLLRASKLPASIAQHPVGEYRLDRAWPERKAAVEADGFEHHGRRLVWRRDRRRIATIEAPGWRAIHVTWDDVTEQPGQTLDRIAILLGILKP